MLESLLSTFDTFTRYPIFHIGKVLVEQLLIHPESFTLYGVTRSLF